MHLTIVLAPLAAAIVAGLFGRQIGRAGAHWVTILAVGLSFVLSLLVLKHLVLDGGQPMNYSVYEWAVVDGLRMEVGFMIDRLSALMMAVVTFVSLMVHVYTIGYMHDDPGYTRFFSHISLFTFSMLMLVMSNNFLQLFFGWEAVGLVSYLLIGFWFRRESAIFANLKAFLVNRVGDFGFILGIAAVVMLTGTLDYATVFGNAQAIAGREIVVFGDTSWNAMTLVCILLFMGAMGKSAQAPLHVWLPDSMEGPTPISALIHAATMVTAGIFMVARMSPLYELSETALAVVLVIGAITAFLMGLLGIVQNDIKRVIAYSTLSQLGYMTVALGVSAYGAAIFHLMTHAFFKALLFLAAGSVIIALHHEQDIRKMGGLRKYMPVTYWTALIGTLALVGFPGTAGFFSKDALIEAVRDSHWQGQGLVYWIAYLSVALGVFVTALYSFRLFFVVFHGEERTDPHARSHLKESPAVVTVPLVLLAIPSAVIGWITIEPILFGGYFGSSIAVAERHDVLSHLAEAYHGGMQFILHAFQGTTVWLAAAGALAAWYAYLKRPDLHLRIRERVSGLYELLVRKYYFDDLYIRGFAAGGRAIGRWLWHAGDELLIDGVVVNGTANSVGRLAGVLRRVQTGYLYHYAFAMIIGLTAVLGWLLVLSAAMDLSNGILSLLIWLPIIGGIAVLAVGDAGDPRSPRAGGMRMLALGVSVLTFLISIFLYRNFDTGTAAMQFVERAPWIAAFNVEYYLGVDGLSAPLVLLTTFMTPLVVIAGWDTIKARPAQYFAAFLILEGLMIGVFSALDGVLFYVMWEAMLVPMFLIIGVWGGERRIYATMKFIYTFFGSVLLLVAFIYLFVQTGDFNFFSFMEVPLTLKEQQFLFIAFLLAFAVKVPMWPVHTWLPDAHVEAPTGGSVILAAIMLKMGGYGFVRISLPMLPDASAYFDGLMIALSLIAIIYISFVALMQRDMKKLIAYSSIAHMGFVTLGFFLLWSILERQGSPSGAALGVTGGMVQMVSHGLVSGALFLCVGVLYDRLHSRQIADYGGVANRMPVFGALMVFFAMANVGLPGTSGFVGEFMVIVASFKASFWYSLGAATILVLGAAYTLWMIKRVVYGEIGNPKVEQFRDLNGRELVVLGVLALAVLLVGLWPAPLVDMMSPSVEQLVEQIGRSKLAAL